MKKVYLMIVLALTMVCVPCALAWNNHVQVPNVDQQTDIVYRTRTGSKYHRHSCRYLRRSSIPIARKDAKQLGLTPCKVCKP